MMSAELLPLTIDPAPLATAGRPACGELRTADGERLPLKALSVDTAIVGMTATSTVRQRFTNTADTAIEATYVFPLPARAGVTDFAATLAGRRVIGMLKERGQARAEYEQALATGQRAAIVEEDRSDVFSVRVGNLGPGEEAVIEMLLSGPLGFEDGEATFRFPLVVAPRYTTGTSLPGDQTGAGVASDTDAVPDASRVTPPRLAEHDQRPDLALSLTLDGAGLALADLRASLPTAVTETSSRGLIRLQVEPGARADRDFVLRFRVDRGDLSSTALLVPDGPDDAAGTWSMTVLPPAETSSAPRDVVIVLDRSGSMNGWKMTAARRAAGRIVDMLDAGDRFCVLAFDDAIDTPPQLPVGLVEASDRNRFATVSWLGTLAARGGTEMTQPMARAVDMLSAAGADRQPSVVLVTDGQISGEDQLLGSVGSSTRIYCVGIDRAVNAGLLERLARLGNGRAELVESEDRLDEVMARLARTIGRPSLTGIRVSADGVDIVDGSVTPSAAADAFAGVPCVISGRYRRRPGGADVAFRVHADAADEPFTMVVAARWVPAAAAVRTIWARAVVRDLEDAYASGQGDEQLAERLVAHSIRFGVLSRFTAFVAVDPEHTDAGPLVEILQPVEQPAGWAGVSRAIAATPAAHRMVDGLAGMPAVHPQLPEAPAPRSLPALIKQVEKAAQVKGRALVRVLDELQAYRDSTPDRDLRAALVHLCNALTRFLQSTTQPHARELLIAADAVKRLLPQQDRGRRAIRRRFWK